MKSHNHLKSFFKVLGSILIVAFLVLFAGLQWPGMWLHANTLNWARGQFNDHFPNFHIQWEAPEVSTAATGLLSNRMLFRFKNFCFKQENQLNSCFRTLSVGFAYNLPEMKLSEIGPIRAGGGTLWYELLANTEETKSKSQNPPDLPQFVAESILRPIYIQIDSYEIRRLQNVFKGYLLVTSSSLSQLDGEQRSIKANLHEESWGDLSAEAITLTEKVKGPWKLQTEANLTFPNHSTLYSLANISPKANVYEYQMTTRYFSKSLSADLQLDGQYMDQTVSTRLNGSVKSGAEIQFNNCRVNIAIVQKSDAQFQTACPVLLPLKQFHQNKIQQLTKSLKHPAIGVRVFAHITTPFPPQLTNELKGRMEVKPFTNFSSVFESHGGITSQFQFIPAQWNKINNLDLNVDWTAQITEFKKLVRLFEQTTLAVPTPFETLEGSLLFKAHGHFTEVGGSLSSLAQTNLASTYQALNTNSKADLKLQLENMHLKTIDLKADVNLKQIELVLPPIESLPPSQILPDRRIRRVPLAQRANDNSRSKQKNLPLTYQFRIHTPDQAPIRLISNVTENPAEIGLDFWIRDHQPIRGTVDLEPINYEIGGVEGTIGGLELNVKSSNFQTVATGKVLDENDDVKAGLVYAESPMDSIMRPQPKLPIPLVELATVVGLQDPLSLTVVDQRQRNAPQNQRNLNSIPLQVRRRF